MMSGGTDPCSLSVYGKFSEAASHLSIASETTLVRPSAAFALFVCAVLHHVKFPALFSLSMVLHPGMSPCYCKPPEPISSSRLDVLRIQSWHQRSLAAASDLLQRGVTSQRPAAAHWMVNVFRSILYKIQHVIVSEIKTFCKTQGSFLPRSDAPVEIRAKCSVC